MNTTKEQRKGKAIELLEKLNVYKPYVKGFRGKDNALHVGDKTYVPDKAKTA